MIHLQSLTQFAPAPSLEPIFENATATLPDGSVCAVFGAGKSGRTTLLQLISRKKKPSHGDVFTTTRLSPIANASSIFHPKLSTLENITVTARCFGMNALELTALAVELPGFESELGVASGKLNPKARRGMETLIAALLPFDIFLLDDIERTAPEVLNVLLKILATRKSRMIFTTRTSKLVEKHANCVTIIRDKKLFTFDTVDAAMNDSDGALYQDDE
jgi:ABC-type polysaccharide/polyol phosphate transport system ATPase subunit